MPQTVTVPLLCSFEHEGRYVAAGESITVTPLEAAQLARRNIVSLTKQTYTHRAMVAAGIVSAPTVMVVADAVTPEIAKPLKPRRSRRKPADTPDTPEKPKRRYRRRNVTAED